MWRSCPAILNAPLPGVEATGLAQFNPLRGPSVCGIHGRTLRYARKITQPHISCPTFALFWCSRRDLNCWPVVIQRNLLILQIAR
jgi:hypothetical protein